MFQILIADSDRAYRRRLYQLLRREGYSVLQASGGEDVLNRTLTLLSLEITWWI